MTASEPDTAKPPQPLRPSKARPDLTTGPIGKTLLVFMLPLLGSNLLQSLNASVNAIWVSHLLGETALTATTNSGFVMFFLLGAVFGVTAASSLLVAQSVGAKDMAQAKCVIGASVMFFASISFFVAAAGYLFAPSILSAMHTPIEARTQAIIYLRIIFLAVPPTIMFAFVQSVLRGAGDSRTPLIFSALVVLLDIGLNPLFILGIGPFPQMGIQGSATATLIATLIGLTGQVSWLYFRNSPLLLRRNEWRLLRFDRDILNSLVTRGLPMGAQLLVASSANVAVISVVNGYGVLTSAAYGAATVIWTYVQMPLTATGLSVSAMGAQNVGAKKWDRVDLIGQEGIKIGLVFTGIPIALIFLLHRPLMGLFLPAGSPSIDIAMEIDTYVLPGYLIMCIAFVYNSVVRATGAVWPPLLCFVIAFWLIRVPVASLGSPYLGTKAIWLSFPVCAVIAVIFSYCYYRFGNWRNVRLLNAS